MASFSLDEVEEFEEVEFQNQKEARINYLEHGQPLSPRHRLYLKEMERKRRGAGVPPSPIYQATHRWETYQQPIYQTYEQTGHTATSTCEASTDGHQRSSFTGNCPKYSVDSPGEPPLTDDEASSVNVPSAPYPQNGGYCNPSAVQPAKLLLNDQTSTMKTMMQRGDNKRNIQAWSAKGSWQGLKAILDDGTEGNWISKKVSDRLNLPIKDGLRKIYTDFDGKRISSVATTEVAWCLDGWSTTETTIFRVAESPRTPFDVLFGRNIISSGEIDFWGENNPIQPLVESEIKPTEQKEIAQNQAKAQSEHDILEEKRKQQKANKHQQAGGEKEKPSKGPK